MRNKLKEQFVGPSVQHRTNLRPMTTEEVRFEIDMCIGCDRCMRACPVPMSSAITIAELNRATISDEIPPHIAQFTEECVMCGSCVPVCPVDNHRDLLMLSLKQRLGVSWNGEVDRRQVLNYLPSGWSISHLLERLREQPMFSDSQLVPENYLLHMVASSKIHALLPGSVFMQEGEYSRTLYLLLDGRFVLSEIGVGGNELSLAVLRRGEYLGEQGMLTGQPCAATARAETAAVILEVPEQVMQHMMELVPVVKRFFERLSDARSLEATLQRMALFRDLPVAEIRLMAEQTTVKHYDRNEYLFREEVTSDQVHDAMHIILEGFVKVARSRGQKAPGERIIAYRQTGDYFAGGMDLMGDGCAVSVTTITRVRIAEIPRSALLALFSRYPQALEQFTIRQQQYFDAATAAQTGNLEWLAQTIPQPASAEARAGLHALVSEGVVEGTEVLVIDLSKCIHCNECEEACARRHGHSRMNRKGMVVGNISIATACRQCQDPVCMLCSRAGIARLPSGEVYITESCIGCGICAERCPYDNISIMTLAEEVREPRSKSQSLRAFFTEGAGKERGRKNIPLFSNAAALGSPDRSRPNDASDELRKKIAIKCDLCAGYDNQACVQACPTGAAIRVQPAAFFGSTEDILRQQGH